MPPIRIGVQLAPQYTTYPSYAHAVQQVEQLGVDSIWNWDHFYPPWDYPKKGDHFEAWTLLSAMATLTTRAEIGCLVTCNSYRNPALLAAMARTVDHISNGRLVLGLGAGWFKAEYEDFGYPFGTDIERLQDLEQALPVIQQHLSTDLPLPVRGKIPLMIGGEGEKITLRLVAQYADAWNGGGKPDHFKHKNAVLNEWCSKVGRDPAQIERSVNVYNLPDIAMADEYVAAGAQHLILNMLEPWDFSIAEKLVRWSETLNV